MGSSFSTAQIKAAPFKLVGPVLKLVVECPCGCGVLTDVPFKGHLWVLAKEGVLFFGPRKGFTAFFHRLSLKLAPPEHGGKVRIVVMKRARLMLTEPVHLCRMAAPPAGARSIPQDEADALAGYRLAEPPPGASVMGYTGPLIPADPQFLPRIQLLMVAEGGWTLAD